MMAREGHRRLAVTGALLLFAMTASALASSASARDWKRCAPLPGWQEIAAEARDKYLVFGEMHGTKEAPAAVGEYVCAVSGDGPVLVAVEFDIGQNALMQELWSGDGAGLREKLVKHMTLMNPVMKDGRSSAAMVEMLLRLHGLKSAGVDIDVTQFNSYRDMEQSRRLKDLPGQEPSETAKAENIRAAAEARDYAHVVVLVGNIHAIEEEITFTDPAWKPMAMKLGSDAEVVTLNNIYSGGASWNCRHAEDGQEACRQWPARDYPDREGSPRMALWSDEPFADAALRARYDGYFHLGEISASAPAGAEQ